MRHYLAVITLLSASTFVEAATLTVHNTGVDSSDSVVAAGEATNFWTLSAQPAGAGLSLGANPVRFKHPSYFADTATSAWVAGSTNGVDNVVGGFAYQLTVDLTGFDPDSAVISGIFGTDNDGSIALNGNAPVATTAFAGFGAPTAFTFSDGFVAGLNTITVAFNNGGGPTAFHVQFSTATASPVPLPGALGLLAGGIAGLGFLRGRRDA
jgi:hypothetical protein